MAILVTGAAGFIGSHLVEKLVQLDDIIGLDNFNTYYDPKIKEANLAGVIHHPRFTLIRGDITDEQTVQEVFRDHHITAVIHLAARAGVRPSIEDPALYYRVNVMGTLNLLEAARNKNVSKFLFASSSSVYGNNTKIPFSESDPVDTPVSPYAATKRAGELMCYNTHHLYGMPIACLRFFTVYGPRQRPDMAIHKFTNLITHDQEIPVFNQGKCLRDFTYIDDIIHGILQIYESPFSFDLINLGESDTIEVLDLIRLIETEIGKSAKLALLPPKPGDMEKTCADIQKARSLYGYSPQYPIQKGIKNFVTWFKQNQTTKTHDRVQHPESVSGL